MTRSEREYFILSRSEESEVHIPVLHRMHYVSEPGKDSIRLALCLYGPLTVDLPGKCYAVDSVKGTKTELASAASSGILSVREKQVLQLIDKGCTSKEIAEILSISANTVSRHRQEIISRLQVKNSIEACRLARDLKII